MTNAEFLEFVNKYPQWRKSRIRALFADVGYLKRWGEGFRCDYLT